MHGYNGKDLARAFRTVRANTIQIAEEIPEEKYGFRAAECTRSIAETLTHLATGTGWSQEMHGQRLPAVEFGLFMAAMQRANAAAAALTTKAQIVDALRTEGDKFAAFLESFPEEAFSERVKYPEGMQPPDKSRFEMLLSAKEHEMHHRGQLMLIERMLGIVPHLTRETQARIAAMQAQAKAQA